MAEPALSAPHVARWDWDRSTGPARLCAELDHTGIAWLRAPELVTLAERDPWAAAECLLGERALLIERQPIRAVPGGRSFAAGCMAAPFHTDSQMLMGVPPHVQVMACRAPAEVGGESLYLDTWTLLERLAADDPALLEQLFSVPRHLPFVFGDVHGPSLSLRGGSLVFTHTPRPRPEDEVARALASHLDATPYYALRAEAGDVLVIHNHRMLHGRRAFDDDRRSFVRVLAWRQRPWPAPARWVERATAIENTRGAGTLGAAIRAAVSSDPSAQRLGVVLEMLRGVPPGVLSAREGIPEPELYAWRDAVLREALQALESA
jgi:gamma-butyrobetaine dioxygenase